MSLSKDLFNGTWTIDEIPNQFIDILKVLGYNAFERKYFQKNKMNIVCVLQGDKLSINIKSVFYTKTKDYVLNGMPIEVDIEGQTVMEIARWLDQTTIQIKTIFLDKNITIIETRQLLSTDQCLVTFCVLHSGDDDPIEVSMLYKRRGTSVPL